jgi:hypothetical protein
VHPVDFSAIILGSSPIGQFLNLLNQIPINAIFMYNVNSLLTLLMTGITCRTCLQFYFISGAAAAIGSKIKTCVVGLTPPGCALEMVESWEVGKLNQQAYCSMFVWVLCDLH